MSASDLTTLNAVKQWFNGGDATLTTNDALIAREITRISSMVTGWMSGVTVPRRSWNDVYNGKGGSRLMLRHFPVLSVTSVMVDGVVVPPNPTPPNGAGYILEAWDGTIPGQLQAVTLNGYWFNPGNQNVSVSYVAGYVQSNETAAIPANGQVVPLQPDGQWASDLGVVYADTGVALTPVADGPAVGQYVPPSPFAGENEVDYYQFNTGETDKALLLTYSFVPWAIEGVTKDLTGERITYRDRIGQKSKSLGGQETVSYEMNVMPKWAQIALQPFVNPVPI